MLSNIIVFCNLHSTVVAVWLEMVILQKDFIFRLKYYTANVHTSFGLGQVTCSLSIVSYNFRIPLGKICNDIYSKNLSRRGKKYYINLRNPIR
jgi:hypothetical protein